MKGFGVTLAIGVLASMVTAMVITGCSPTWPSPCPPYAAGPG